MLSLPPDEVLQDITALPAMPQQVIGQRDGQHGFGHGNGANADAGVMPSGCADGDVLSVLVHAASGGQDGGCRLDGQTHDNRLTTGNAAQNATGMIGQECDTPLVGLSHLVGIVFP